MKKKLAQKLHIIKVDGLTKRWLLNILLVVVVLLIAAFVAASVFIKNYYYESVRNILESGASANSAEYFSANLDSGMSLETSAAQFIDSYSYKDKTTVWVINNDGEVIASSNGFIIENCEMPDYTSAMSGSDGTGEYTGRITDGGDKIMALARVMQNSRGTNVGAVRVMTSIGEVDTQLGAIILILFFIILFIFGIILLSNLFFIRSIIIPIREITETTKKIAGGNLDSRIEKKYDDEIGNLCDSINSMASEIATADKMKNDFISTISHELRTPLTSIKGWAETLFYSKEIQQDELTVKGLDVIVKESGRLEGFVE